MAATLSEQIGVDQLEPGHFVSRALPIRLGNSLPIAYGGCAVAVAVHAACQTVTDKTSLYSVVGHFLGPATTDRHLYCVVHETRNTRSFSTRRVQVKQKLDNGEDRVCMELIADFHADEPTTLEYSASPILAYPKPLDCLELEERVNQLQGQGLVTSDQAKGFGETFGSIRGLFETRYCPNGVAGQNLAGALKSLPTTQDHLHATRKASAEWQKAKGALPTRNQNFAALAFLMDGALSFLPLTHNHMWFDDVAACSTLDFALRIFTPSIDMTAWTLRERVGSRAGSGRTYSEGRLWDEEGNLIASITQQSILRLNKSTPKPSL